MRFLLVAVAAVAVGGAAAAQGPRTPTYSPYLNLLRRGNSPGVNYYGLVRPEVDGRNAVRSLQGQVLENRRTIADQGAAVAAALPATGEKAVAFQNTGGYFMNMNPQATGTGTGFGTLSLGAGGGSGLFGGNKPPARNRPAGKP